MSPLREAAQAALAYIHYSRREHGQDEPQVGRNLRAALAQTDPSDAEIERLRSELLSIRVAAQQACQSFADGTDMQSSMDRLESVLDVAMKERV